jgi:hypothetical protein
VNPLYFENRGVGNPFLKILGPVRKSSAQRFRFCIIFAMFSPTSGKAASRASYRPDSFKIVSMGGHIHSE